MIMKVQKMKNYKNYKIKYYINDKNKTYKKTYKKTYYKKKL